MLVFICLMLPPYCVLKKQIVGSFLHFGKGSPVCVSQLNCGQGNKCYVQSLQISSDIGKLWPFVQALVGSSCFFMLFCLFCVLRASRMSKKNELHKFVGNLNETLLFISQSITWLFVLLQVYPKFPLLEMIILFQIFIQGTASQHYFDAAFYASFCCCFVFSHLGPWDK